MNVKVGNYVLSSAIASTLHGIFGCRILLGFYSVGVDVRGQCDCYCLYGNDFGSKGAVLLPNLPCQIFKTGLKNNYYVQVPERSVWVSKWTSALCVGTGKRPSYSTMFNLGNLYTEQTTQLKGPTSIQYSSLVLESCSTRPRSSVAPVRSSTSGSWLFHSVSMWYECHRRKTIGFNFIDGISTRQTSAVVSLACT